MRLGRYARTMRKVLGVPPRLLRWSARLLVLALTLASLGPALHGVHADDCEPLFVVHDASAHNFHAVAPDAAPLAIGEHCVACHFARSSRGPVSWVPNGLTNFVSGNLLPHSTNHLVAFLFAAPLPARAPPRV